jgi:hypothetical protein
MSATIGKTIALRQKLADMQQAYPFTLDFQNDTDPSTEVGRPTAPRCAANSSRRPTRVPSRR